MNDLENFEHEVVFVNDGSKDKTLEILEANKEKINFKEIIHSENLSKVSIVGVGIANKPGVAVDMFEALYQNNINMHMVSTSEIKISVLVNIEEANNAKKSYQTSREEFDKAGLTDKVWQFFTVVPDFRTTGVKNGKRAYDWPVIIRAVNTVDAMVCTVPEIEYSVLKKITERILSEVDGVCRVLYDLSPKPSATIEWE